jgi:hypothetical protein
MSTPNYQLPTAKAITSNHLGESRGCLPIRTDLHPDAASQTPWELEVGGWELTVSGICSACLESLS